MFCLLSSSSLCNPSLPNPAYHQPTIINLQQSNLQIFTMPAWDDKKHFDLLCAFHDGAKGEAWFQDRVVASMKARGYEDTNWDMIR